MKEISHLASPCDAGLWFMFFALHSFLRRTFFLFQWHRCPGNSHWWNLSLCSETCLPSYISKDQEFMTLSFLPIEYSGTQRELEMGCAESTAFPISYLYHLLSSMASVCFPSNVSNAHRLTGDVWRIQSLGKYNSLCHDRKAMGSEWISLLG